MNDNKMTPGELRATWGLGTVFSLRMLGMFMVLPVLTTYGMALQGASEALIGLAIGIYGLAQAVFQIPFGLLSDRIGRKPLIIGGLLIFVIGSIIAAPTRNARTRFVFFMVLFLLSCGHFLSAHHDNYITIYCARQ